MNKSFIRYTIGTVLKIEAALLLIPVLTAVIYKEKEGFIYLLVALLAGVLGFILSLKKPSETVFFLRDGCFITVFSWLTLSFVGGLPFFFTGEMNGSFIDSMFESVSGFTTTGATILSDVEVLSKCTQIWRSLSHWIGGMGVLVFLLALIPLTGGSNINLMRAESTGPSVGKLAPKLMESARILYSIYIVLTILQIAFLVIGDTPLFDSVNIALSTTGTGGFGIKNDSLASYSQYVQWVTVAFMVMSALKFDFYYFLITRGMKRALSEEVIVYVLIFICSSGIIFIDLLHKGNPDGTVLNSAFTASSIMSTTGFGTADFDKWPEVSKTVLCVLTFIGGCTGSTGGGFKVSRIVILLKSFRREIISYISPRSVKKLKMDGAVLDEEIVRSTSAYFSIYIIIFVVSVVLVSVSENDLITNFTSVAATFNNVGPGLSMVGPTGNFGFHTIFSKIVLIFDMLAGRLEIFPMLVLFSRKTH